MGTDTLDTFLQEAGQTRLENPTQAKTQTPSGPAASKGLAPPGPAGVPLQVSPGSAGVSWSAPPWEKAAAEFQCVGLKLLIPNPSEGGHRDSMSVGFSWALGELLQLSRVSNISLPTWCRDSHSPSHKPQPQRLTKPLCLRHMSPSASARLSRGRAAAGGTSSLSPAQPSLGPLLPASQAAAASQSQSLSIRGPGPSCKASFSVPSVGCQSVLRFSLEHSPMPLKSRTASSCSVTISTWIRTSAGLAGLTCVHVHAQSCPTLVTPQTAARQIPPSMGFSRRQYWSG